MSPIGTSTWWRYVSSQTMSASEIYSRKCFGETLRRIFPTSRHKDVCLFIASHGLPLRLIRMGDPAVDQMLDVVEDLEKRLPEFPVYHGFLNDDFFPGAEWVSPPSDDTAWDIRSDSCPAVLMDGRLSFTTHHRATLFDLDVDAREIIEEPQISSQTARCTHSIAPHRRPRAKLG